MALERRDWRSQFHFIDNQRMEGSKKLETKSLPISKRMVYEAYLTVRKGGKAAGVDGMTLTDLESDLSNQLYKLWNRMSSGSYFPPAVRACEIEKKGGGVRKLGIPTLLDRIAQTVVKTYLTPGMEEIFHEDSFGYRPGRSQHDALKQVGKRNWNFNWVIDMDIRKFFDELDHSLLSKALDRVVKDGWARLYIDRWLQAGIVQSDGEVLVRTVGTPQGGVISPLLANLYLHYTFDKWLAKTSHCRFTRFADDIIVHCHSLEQASSLLASIDARMKACKLRLHPEKTKIVYCGLGPRGSARGYPRKYTFLGFDFRPVQRFNRRTHEAFTGYGCVPSSARTADMVSYFREVIGRRKVRLAQIASTLNDKLRGWLNYFCFFNRRALSRVMHLLNNQLKRWLSKTHKRFRNRAKASARAMRSVYDKRPALFAHWNYGYTP